MEMRYFKGLNALRFIAAILVVINHVEMIKSIFGRDNILREPLIFESGSLGVYFFFVLSGFLITYILLDERKREGSISMKNFYIKRILRIWPLYFLIFFLGFFILPKIDWFYLPYFSEQFELHYVKNLISYIVILPNIAYSTFPAVPHIGQSWSIGVEEQFYLFWPFIIAYSSKVFKSIFSFLILYIGVKIAIVLYLGEYVDAETYSFIKHFFAMNKFESMAIGAIGAYFVHSNSKYLDIVQNRLFAVMGICMIPLLVYFFPNSLQDGVHIVQSLIFLYLIMHFSLSDRPLVNLENRLLNFLGKISYGIYMYHFVVVFSTYKLLDGILDISSNIVFNLLVYSLSIAMTIGISAVSFKYFENPFLKMKRKIV